MRQQKLTTHINMSDAFIYTYGLPNRLIHVCQQQRIFLSLKYIQHEMKVSQRESIPSTGL